MPVSPRIRQQHAADHPERLRPYLHHGVELAVRGGHGVGDCPFCGGNGKFSASCDTGLWRCWVCGGGDTPNGGGNPLTFLRLLHSAAVASSGPDFLEHVAADRRLCSGGTPASWGMCRSPVPPHPWIVPGYGPDGRLHQLYRRTWVDSSWLLLPTPGVWPEGKVHGLHLPLEDFDPDRSAVIICEGPWDGMALWECYRETWGDINIIAVPGCNVWRDEWTELCRGKQVILLYDSDHPRIQGNQTFRAGHDGMHRVAKRLSGVATLVRWIRWGPDGWDESKPSGWDVRDILSGSPRPPLSIVDRRIALTELLTKVEDVPADWSVSTPSSNGRPHIAAVESQSCQTWAECEAAWMEAMQWRRDMSDALAVLLAVCASTQQGGNQLFLQLVGSAGSGKTTMCDGLLVSHHCHHLEHLTGFHSGFKKPGESGKDCSLIARINGKTLVTPEADILMSSPRFAEIMGQQRRIFDGKSGATYKNSDEDTLYVGLRTPWIMAGTPALMDTDQSHLGDRFLRFIIGDPGEDEKRAILRSALRSERCAMSDTANGTAGSIVDLKTRKAHALTGGYVDWLRTHVEELLARVDVNQSVEERCIDLAELSADLRARPNEDRRKVEVHDSKELPTRLARQNIRMAICLAVVLNKRSVDADVLGIVRKVALDTAHGHSLNITRWLCSVNPKVGSQTYQASGGLMAKVLEVWLSMTEERVLKYLLFLRKIGVLELRKTKQSLGSWVLTDRVYDLYLRVMGG